MINLCYQVHGGLEIPPVWLVFSIKYMGKGGVCFEVTSSLWSGFSSISSMACAGRTGRVFISLLWSGLSSISCCTGRMGRAFTSSLWSSVSGCAGRTWCAFNSPLLSDISSNKCAGRTWRARLQICCPLAAFFVRHTWHNSLSVCFSLKPVGVSQLESALFSISLIYLS